MMRNKLGPYINKLMTTIVDSETEGIIRDLALAELRRLKVDIQDFIQKNVSDEETKSSEKTIKTLLQEEKTNGKNTEWNNQRWKDTKSFRKYI